MRRPCYQILDPPPKASNYERVLGGSYLVVKMHFVSQICTTNASSIIQIARGKQRASHLFSTFLPHNCQPYTMNGFFSSFGSTPSLWLCFLDCKSGKQLILYWYYIVREKVKLLNSLLNLGIWIKTAFSRYQAAGLCVQLFLFAFLLILVCFFCSIFVQVWSTSLCSDANHPSAGVVVKLARNLHFVCVVISRVCLQGLKTCVHALQIYLSHLSRCHPAFWSVCRNRSRRWTHPKWHRSVCHLKHRKNKTMNSFPFSWASHTTHQ